MTLNKQNIADIYPLSPMQQGILFHTLSAPGVYFEQVIFSLRGPLNLALFQQAWQQAIEQHAVLRTFFVWENRDEPLQIVRHKVSLPWRYQDWQGQTEAEQQIHLDNLLQSDQNQGFNLAQAPLFRLTLVTRTPDSYFLIFSFHHLILDRWSIGVLFQQVLGGYQAAGQNNPWPAEPVRPYRDYIGWLRQQDLAPAEQFWRQNLRGMTAPTPLPVGRPPQQPGRQPSAHQSEQTQLSRTLTAALQTMGQQHRLTLNTLVQAAWALLLRGYSGHNDLLFGMTVSGRPPTLAGMEQMVGLFVNTLPVRAQIPPGQLLLDWLQQFQEHLLALPPFHHSPLVALQRWSQMPPGQPLFETVLVFENIPLAPASPESEPALQIQQVGYRGSRTNYPLAVLVSPGPRLSLEIVYDADRFEAADIRRMLDHFRHVLAEIVANPQQKLANLSLLTKAERRQQLVTWNKTEIPYPNNSGLHQLFEAQVRQQPGAIALQFGEQQLTYGALNSRANQLARYLRKQGVGPEVVVGLCLSRSPEMIIGLLAILKAGGAYLPLDPSYPRARLALMISDAAVPLLLTESALTAQLPQSTASIICLDRVEADIDRESPDNLPAAGQPDNLAYVIYTSGSSGTPKGVPVPHRGLCNLAQAQMSRFNLSPADRVLQFSSLSFDAATFEIVMALSHGATLCLPLPEARYPGPALVRLLHRQKISIVTLPPSVLAALPVEPLPHLRIITAAGEACPASLVERWAAGRQFFNLYGPTEATIWTTAARLPDTHQPPPIGRPIDNVQTYILDAGMQPRPVGLPGELYIGGIGVARGYRHRPGLTAKTFVPHPFSDTPGARLYKTGDLARYRPDGQIEFLGRIDQQLKIRGFRIEPGEIEATLRRHPAVKEAMVVARPTRADKAALVAYLIPRAGHNFNPAELGHFLAEKLPNYMVPVQFITLDQLPLTPNGKLDRRALPDPAPETGGRSELPRTPLEKALARIWADVLELERVGRHDNFFELGGHSLLATQVVYRLRDTFKTEISLLILFEAPTVAQLAKQLIQSETRPGHVEKIARLLEKIEGMSAEELSQSLAQKRRKQV